VSGEVPSPAPVPAREAAREVAAALVAAGHEALFAGGCVRDRLLGREPDDFDIATDATPEAIRAVFPKARGVGEAFGVMLVRHRRHTFEVATFREDGPYHDGRRPSEVRFSDARGDAMRRDFTVNGLFERPGTGEVIDFVGGEADLQAGVLRAIGDPHARIREDRLRMLRAVRFAARLGFAIDDATRAAVAAHADELAAVSPERVGDELRRMLAHPERARAARLVEEFGLDAAVFGSRVPASGTRLARLARTAGASTVGRPGDREEGAWVTPLAAWWLDRVEGEAGCADRPDARLCESAVAVLRERLVLSNHETARLAAILAARGAILAAMGAPGGFADVAVARRKRLFAADGFDDALLIVATERPEEAVAVRALADAELPERRLPTPILDGNALIAAGHRPGPGFKRWLDLALDAQLEGLLSGVEDALALVRAAETPDGA
jgi:poly(A) polymerase